MSTKTTEKKAAEKAINENVNKSVNNAENSQLEIMAKKAKQEANELMEKAKKAAIEAKKAAIEAKEAAKKAKSFTSRPVRKCTFEVACNGDFVTKSDVHYCAEKAAIDALMEIRATVESDHWNEYGYSIHKVSKETNEDGTPVSSIEISQLYIDKTTGQIVIE